MQCLKCEYPLWNLRSRECPECGTAFLPSAYSFVPDTVRFNCPHCGQTYYGTSANGHLEPPSFQCVGCARAVDMDEMVLLPAEGVQEAQTKPLTVPWVDPEKGFFSRWFGTIGMVIASPVQLIRALPRPVSGSRALGFAVLTNLMYTTVGAGLIFMLPFLIGAGMGARGGGLLAVTLGLAVAFALPLLTIFILIMLWAAATHALLRLTGPTDGPWGRTLAAMCYSSAANILIAIPCMGFYMAPVSWIWWGVSATLMIRDCQRVSGPRATAAVFVPVVLIGALVAGGIAASFMGLQASLLQAQTAARAAQTQSGGGAQTLAMLQSILSYGAAHSAGPEHAIMLVPDQGLANADFYIGAPPLPTTGVNWIDAVGAMPEDEQAAAISGAAASMPPDVVAHRLGEFVFIYHGIDLSPGSPADGGLWLVVGIPPAAMASPGQPRLLIAGRLDGQVVPILVGDLPQALADQNALRTAAGLAPLPDPMTVTERPSAPGDE